MAGSVLHWASRGGPSPTGTTVGEVPLLAGGFCVLHTHGWTCGPVKTGPLIGWLVIVIRAPRPSGSWASTRLGPLASPVTRPTPSGPKADVTSRSPTVTVRPAEGWTRTSASPPEIRSARL